MAQVSAAMQAIGLVQAALNEIESWLAKWHIKPNAAKTEALIFNTKIQDLATELQFCGHPVPGCNHELQTHLEILHSHSACQSQLLAKVAVSTHASSQLTPHLKLCNHLSLSHSPHPHLRLICLGDCSPLLPPETSSLSKQNTLHHHQCTRVDTITQHIHKLATGLYNKIPTTDNPLVRELANYDERQVWRRPRPKALILPPTT
ncbi:hypothetical protein PR048_002855 [Dryococelus australis]|uniref:Uncharacterized protein n=1 Tax=Dryococelus australis TaxID=614101 RepID=A0ABQ9ILD0_9NEOP|nr:hypothetical protein PR048_002855 [Dryococelus australis]